MVEKPLPASLDMQEQERPKGFLGKAFSYIGDLLGEMSAALRPRTVSSGRALTQDEIEFARGYFGDEINYGEVRVHKARMLHVAFADSNHLFFSKKLGDCSDLTQGKNLFNTVERRALFIHEMTHVWQDQKQPRLLSKMRAAFMRATGQDPYAYNVNDKTAFRDMGIEQQARLMQDFCRAHEFKKLGQEGDSVVRLVGLDEDERYPAFVKKIQPVFPFAASS